MSEHELLARAFHDDPFIRWAEPDAERRPRTMARVFSGMLSYAARSGGHVYEPGIGSVHWRDAPAAHMGTWSVATSGTWLVALTAPPSVWLRLSIHEDSAMARIAPFLGDGSVYLSAMGVEPALAGRGHGSRLLQRALPEMAKRWRTCVLRTEQPKNVPFYVHNGFRLVDEQLVPESGLHIWVLMRSLDRLGDDGPRADRCVPTERPAARTY